MPARGPMAARTRLDRKGRCGRNFSTSPGVPVANRQSRLSPEWGGIVKLGASAPSSDPPRQPPRRAAPTPGTAGRWGGPPGRQWVLFRHLGADAPSLTISSRWDFPDSHPVNPPPGLVEKLRRSGATVRERDTATAGQSLTRSVQTAQ